jgi:hypothetical protein
VRAPRLPDGIANCLCLHWGRLWLLVAECVGEFPRKRGQIRWKVAGIESASSYLQYKVFRGWPPRHTSRESLSLAWGNSIETLHDRNIHIAQQCLKVFPIKMNITPVHRKRWLRLKLGMSRTQVADPDFIELPAKATLFAEI